jgi:synaptic vesicle membrane protein VAT-1
MSTPDATGLLEIVLPGKVEPEGLQLRRGPVPAPAAGQVVVRVEATGVSFAEQQMRRGRYYDQPPFPFVPGYDLVGTVAATGPGADRELLGTRVAALTKTGGWASHVVLDAADTVEVPEGVGAAEAETAVVNGITAWQMLHRRARVHRGRTVLVHGANGGVGSVLVQLARAAGVQVIGTASPRPPRLPHRRSPGPRAGTGPRRRGRGLRPCGRPRPDRLLAAARPWRHPRLLRQRRHP